MAEGKDAQAIYWNETQSNEVKDLQKQLQDAKIEAERTLEVHEKMETMVQHNGTDSDKILERYEMLMAENVKLRQSAWKYNMQLKTQRERHASHLDADFQFIEELGTKNEEFGKAVIEELQKLTDANKIQTINIRDLQKEAEDARMKVKQTDEENIQLKTVLLQSEIESDNIWENFQILKIQNDQFRQDIQDFKTMTNSQIEYLISFSQDELEYSEKIKEKDDDLTEAIEKLQKLSDNTTTKSNTIKELENKLQDARTELEKTNQENVNLQTVIQERQSEAQKLWEENKTLKAQVKQPSVKPKKGRLRKIFRSLCCCFSSPE